MTWARYCGNNCGNGGRTVADSDSPHPVSLHPLEHPDDWDVQAAVRIGLVDIPQSLVLATRIRRFQEGQAIRRVAEILLARGNPGELPVWSHLDDVNLYVRGQTVFSGVLQQAGLSEDQNVVLIAPDHSQSLQLMSFPTLLFHGLTHSEGLHAIMRTAGWPDDKIQGLGYESRPRRFFFAVPMRNTTWTPEGSGTVLGLSTDLFVFTQADTPMSVLTGDLTKSESRERFRTSHPEWFDDRPRLADSLPRRTFRTRGYRR